MDYHVSCQHKNHVQLKAAGNDEATSMWLANTVAGMASCG